jgi:Protein of unknown function (DUF4239)
MLSLTQNVVIFILAMTASLLFMVALNRYWPVARRYTNNDLIGWQLSVLGTTYAVILGFMLYTEWTGFRDAELNVDLEASAVRNLYRLAEGLPAQQRAQLEQQTRAYADAVVRQDWPAMEIGRLPEESHEVNESMWRTLMSIKSSSTSEATAADHALSELTTLTKHRRTRLLQSASELPSIFWCVLLSGAVLTIISVSMFGSGNPRLHTIQVMSITLLVTLVMLAIADVNYPFRGWVHVSNYAFQRAQNFMN